MDDVLYRTDWIDLKTLVTPPQTDARRLLSKDTEQNPLLCRSLVALTFAVLPSFRCRQSFTLLVETIPASDKQRALLSVHQWPRTFEAILGVVLMQV